MNDTTSRVRVRGIWQIGAAAGLMALTSCTSPMERSVEQQLREQIAATRVQYLEAAADAQPVRVTRATSEVEAELSPERRAELDKISGPTAYQDMAPELGRSLTGEAADQTATVGISLSQAVQQAVRNNLSVQVSELAPQIDAARVEQAEAVFDAVLFGSYDYQNLDTPLPRRLIGTETYSQSHNHSLTAGVRKRLLATGGDVTLQTTLGRIHSDPSNYVVRSYYNANVMASITQPLLRNFGSEMSQAEIRLATSARDQSAQDLRTQLLDTALETERAYWNLVLARQQLLIQQRLLERTIVDRDVIKKREPYDASPVRLTEANSFVELRRADVIRARQTVRGASDALKRLINDPELSVASETLIVPSDTPLEEPVEFSLLDAIRTGLEHRPEIRKSLLLINDTQIRQRVAENLRLPKLDVTAGIRFNGEGRRLGYAIDNISDLDYIDYLLGVQFEQAVGNRLANSLVRQRQLERRASVLNYRRQAQDVVIEIKTALRQIETAYELIGAARAARRAASDNLRALERQEEAGVALTPEFLLDLKLSTQQRLANAEVQEIQALTDYNTAIANYYRTTGTLLDRNQVQVIAADPAQDQTPGQTIMR